MKKRFLSAALALAMMLTMLPMTVFAADPVGVSVTYYAQGATLPGAAPDSNTATDAGWYSRSTTQDVTVDGKKYYSFTLKSGGVVTGTNPASGTAKWFSSLAEATNGVASDGKNSSITLLAPATLDVSSVAVSTLTINTNGQNLSFSGKTTAKPSATDPANANYSFTGITLTNSTATPGSLSGSIEVAGKNFSFKATNVGAKGTAPTIELDSKTNAYFANASNTLTVDLNNAHVGNITTSNAKGTIKVYNGGSAGDITLGGTDNNLTKTGGSVTVETRGEVGDTSIYGTGTVNMSGLSSMGALTVYGGTKAQNGGKAVTAKTTATITNSTVASIAQAAGDEAGHTINLSSSSTVTSGIDLSKGGSGTINVTDSTVGATSNNSIQIARGTVNIKNSFIPGFTVAGNATETASVTINVGTKGQSDSSQTAGMQKFSGSPATPALYVYGGAVGAIDPGYSVEFWGGAAGSRIDRTNLKGGLAEGYEAITVVGGYSTYHYTTKFQDLVDLYKTGADFTAYRVNDTGDTAAVKVTFKWDNASEILTVLTVTANTFVDLPSVVNETKVNYWYDETAGVTKGIESGKQYPVGASNLTLVAHLDPNTSSTVTGVRAKDKDGTPIGCKLNGSTIELSGAVNTISTTGAITIEFQVDGVWTPARSVTALWESKTGTITLSEKSGDGIVLPIELSNTMRIFNTTYTVTGKGLKAMVSGIRVDNALTGTLPVVSSKANAGMSGAYTVLGQDVKAFMEANSTVDFSNSNGVKAALNDLVSKQTESGVNGIINSARNAMASADNKAKVDGRTDHKANEYTGYNTVVLTPYLDVTFRNNPTVFGNGQNTALNLEITLKYRYSVVNANGDVAYKELNADGTVKTKFEQVGNLTPIGDFGYVTIGLALPDASALSFTEKRVSSHSHHQGFVNNVDVSNITGGKKLTFNTFNGFSPFDINNEPGKIKLQNKQNDGSWVDVTAYTFNNVQTAVDTVANGQKIVVDDDYTGSISVTGAAKSFEITAVNGHTVTITGVNGAATTYDYNKNTGSYNVMLAAQTTGATADIKVNAASYGVATANTSKATVGSTVTITTVPNTGYRTQSVTAVTNTGASVAVSNPSANTYTFVVPSNATTVTVTPTFMIDQGLPFTDVKTTDSFYSAVRYCYEHSLIQGTTTTTFAPYGAITRGQIVTILWRQAGSQRQTPTGLFSDMPGDTDMYNAVIWAANLGIAKGYEDGKFYPARAINRQELATFLYRYETLYLKKTPTGSVSSLNNYNGYTYVGSWAQNEMRWAVGNNILPNAATNLAPTENAPRWQAAMAMQQYCQNILGIK